MSAIAQILHQRGEMVSGSDINDNDATQRLRAAGIRVSQGHDAGNIEGADVVIYTVAVPKDNPEIAEARRRGIPLIERAAMLGRIIEPYQRRVAIAGTHGKTTTTSMVNAIFDHAQIDASVLVGGSVSALNGNARLGESSTIVVEACEAFESFLHLHPSVAVVTNIDAEHLDYYGSIENIEDSFRQFISQVDPDGCVAASADDPRVRSVVKDCGRRVVWFGLSSGADILAQDVDVSTPQASYTLVLDGSEIGRITLRVPGRHNVLDSLAAVAAALQLGVPFEDIQGGLSHFKGVHRRFEILGDGDIMVVDDYAHHPTEVEATLTSARTAYHDRRLVVVFQPHLYSRTRTFAREFARALAHAHRVVVTDIFASRERPPEQSVEWVSSQAIVDLMDETGFADVEYYPDKDNVANDLFDTLKSGDLVLVMGAGDIRMVGEQLARMLRERSL